MNRLSEYFAELEEIAKTDPQKASSLKHEHLQQFVKKPAIFYIQDKPNIAENIMLYPNNDTMFGSCTFSSNPFSSNNMNGIFILDGNTYDFNGNPIDLNEDDDEANWWKK